MHQHVVKQGDTLWKLSKAWGVPLSDMIKANPQLKNPNVLLTGEVVNVPKPGSPIVVPEIENGAHPGSTHHHPLHPLSVMQGVQGLVNKIPTDVLPSIPFVGKKSTAPIAGKADTSPIPGKADTAPITGKADTAPIPLPTPVPEPEPAPVEEPVAEAPVEEVPVVEPPVQLPIIEIELPIEKPKPTYGYGVPQEMKPTYGYGLPQEKPTYGYGLPQETKPSYGYQAPHEHEKHIDLFQQYGIPATEVLALQELPKYPEEKPASHGYGYGGPTAPVQHGHHGYGYGPQAQPTYVSPAEEDDCPPTGLGASTLPWGAPVPITPPHGYGYETSAPADNAGYGSGYGYGSGHVSPIEYGGHTGYGDYNPTVSPTESGHAGYGYGETSTGSINLGHYGYGQPTASPVDHAQHGYGHGPTAVSPQETGHYGYGYGPTLASPVESAHHGYGYGYGHGGQSPIEAPHGGYGYDAHNVAPQAAGPWGVPTYGYSGYGQISPLQTLEVSKKLDDCGCGDNREKEAEVQAEDDFELKLDLPQASHKPARKPVKKAAAKTRSSRSSQSKRHGASLPWINR
nr:LysM peptidoglycan-binding domain-containing protein [Paenibacillus phyllosphaerae]